MRRLRRALGLLGLAALFAAALAGLLLSGAYLLLSTEAGRALLVPRLLAVANARIAGRLELDGFSVGAAGGLEIRGLRILDPRGERVLEVQRASGQVDLSRLRSRRISLRLSVSGFDLALARQPGESWNLEAALALREPAPPAPPAPLTWTIRLARFDLAGGAISVRDGTSPEQRVRDLSIVARAIVSPRGGRGELSARGTVALPAERPLSLEVAASQTGDRIAVPHLRAAIGETVLDLSAEGSVAARSGRLAIAAASLRPEDLRLLSDRAALEPLTATGYAESDGRMASAALSLRPASGGGSGDLAVAARLPPADPRQPLAPQAIGLDLRLDRLDPSRVSPLLPPGDIRLTASGHASGTDLSSLRAAVVVAGARSRLRTGHFGPLALRARAEGGSFEIARLDAALPGATLAARGAWRPLGPVSGSLVANATDLGALARNLSALTGEKLPRLGGQGRIEGSLAGTSREPDARLRLQAPRMQVEEVVATGAALEAGFSGPAASRQARLDAAVARLTASGIEARSLTAHARLAGATVEAQLSAVLPEVGEEPFLVRGRGDLSEDRGRFTLAELVLAWPGTRFELGAPARIELSAPRVDRLELRSGPQRLALAGGFEGSALDATLTGDALELARLPSRLLPQGLGLAGALSFSARAQGKRAAPRLSAHAELANGSARGLTGLGAVADATLDLASRRAAGTLSVRGLAGGRAELSADLPIEPGRAGAAEALSLTASADGLDVPALLRAAGLPEELRGRVSGKIAARGTVGAPSLEAEVGLAEGAWGDYGPIALRATAEERARRLEVTLAVDHGGVRALAGHGAVALDLAALLRNPAREAAALRRAHFEAGAEVPGLELATLAGRGHLPDGLAGKLTASLSAAGSAEAPRGELRAEVVELAHAGFSGIGAVLAARAEEGATSATLTARGGGQELLSARLRLGRAIEHLLDAAALRAAPLSAQLEAGATDLSRLRAPAGLSGSAALSAKLGGTLDALDLDARAGAQRLSVSGRAVGDLTATLRAAGDSLAAQASLAAPTGGRVEAALEARLPVALATLEGEAWRAAPAKARLTADALDLAVLAAAAPGSFRSSSGRLDANLRAEGPLGKLRPTGELRVAGGRANVVGGGEWHDVELLATLSADAVRLERLSARRGKGSVETSGAVTGLAGAEPAKVEARLATRQLLLSSAGQDLATLDLDASLTGTATAEGLRAELTILDGRAVLPGRSPRPLQSLEPRKDVVVGHPRAAPPRPAGEGYRVEVHLLVPGRFKVRSQVPTVDMTLRGDTTFTLADGEVAADGRMEAVDGSIETYGRLFKVRRATVTFAGGPAAEGVVDAEALWTENPAARVKVAVLGPVSAPAVKMTSEPPLDEGTIALLIATGRTESKAGTGGVSGITGEEAGSALLGALATKALRDVLQDKLPIDVVPVSATQIRAGVYVSDTVYIGYTRRLDANPELGQNANEGRVEWQMSPRWTLETRYGDANTGSLSVVWSKDY